MVSHTISNFTNLVKDVFTGNITGVEKRLSDWWNGAPSWLKNLVTTAETDEGQILSSLVPVVAKDVIAGGFSTASFVAAAKDVGAQLAAKNITMAQTVIFSALNAEVANQASAAGIAVPTNTGTSVVAAPVDPAQPSGTTAAAAAQ